MKHPTNKHQLQVMENVLSEKHNWILYYTTDQKQLVNETADVPQTVWGIKRTSRSYFSFKCTKIKKQQDDAWMESKVMSGSALPEKCAALYRGNPTMDHAQ